MSDLRQLDRMEEDPLVAAYKSVSSPSTSTMRQMDMVQRRQALEAEEDAGSKLRFPFTHDPLSAAILHIPTEEDIAENAARMAEVLMAVQQRTGDIKADKFAKEADRMDFEAAIAEWGGEIMPDATEADKWRPFIEIYGEENLAADLKENPDRALIPGRLPAADDPTRSRVGGFSGGTPSFPDTYTTPATHERSVGSKRPKNPELTNRYTDWKHVNVEDFFQK